MQLPQHLTQQTTEPRYEQSIKDGWAVFPLRTGGKEPALPASKHDGPDGTRCRGECNAVGHGVYDATSDPEAARRLFRAAGDASSLNVGGACAGLLVVDLDTQHMNADSWAAVEPLPPTLTHWSGRGNSNRHLIYRLPEGASVKAGTNALGSGVDIKTGEGSYIVLPGSVHPEGGEYWVDDVEPAEPAEAPSWLVESLQAGRPNLRVIQGSKGQTDANTLSGLLSSPPTEGGRNVWLTKVCGHYAKQYSKMQDLYWVHVEQANALLAHPLPREEVVKTGESIWETESTANGTISPESGYLSGNGQELAVAIKTGNESGIEQFADFDLTCHGVAVGEEGLRTYWVTVHSRHGAVEATMDSRILGDSKALAKWLAGYGVSIAEPILSYPKVPSATRILRYLNNQNPPTVEVVDRLGWNDRAGGYVVPQGTVTAAGLVDRTSSTVCADPQLVANARYHYGQEGTREDAVRVLREVLTYQDPEITSVFGAWWAAVLAKAQIRAHTSMFPFAAVEAASGSGKTNGFFNLMVQLSGSQRPEGTMTRAVTRTIASYNSSGIAWIDDMDHIETVTEVLRAATSGGSMSKMGVDHQSAESIQLVSAVLVTGEHLGFNQEKALADRSVSIAAKSPVGRSSQKPGRENRPQWEDVVELTSRYPRDAGGLTVLAGWYLQIMAEMIADGRVEHAIRAALADPEKRSGRRGDRDLVLLTGARLLGEMTGDKNHLDTVRAWIGKDAAGGYSEQDNTLTLRVLPRLLRELAFTDQVRLGTDRDRYNFTPVLVKQVGGQKAAKWWLGEGGRADAAEVEIWMHLPEVADFWANLHGGRVDMRTESEPSLRQQVRPLKTRRTSVRVAGRVVNYRALSGPMAQEVLRRALDDVSD